MDLLENDVLCKKCNVTMQKGTATKGGFKLRAFQCPSCQVKYFHPVDLERYEQYHKLKTKQFSMKLRMIGNSYCISIPREIIRFNNIEEDSMVSLSMEDPERVGLIFHKRIYRGGTQ